jgi:hypothetical protein
VDKLSLRSRLMQALRALAQDVRVMRARGLVHLSAAEQRALIWTFVSLLVWSAWNAQRDFEHPWGDLAAGRFTDHISHMNAARLFPRVGRDLWRVPIAKQFRPQTHEEHQRMPRDVRMGGSETGGVYVVPDWPEDKPLVMGWTNKTRMYPPGDMLLVAPIALLYHYTSLSLTDACRLLIGWYIVLGHVALFFVLLSFFESRGSGIAWLIAFMVYANVMRFTLEGFYDGAVIAPLLLCARYLARGRGLAATVAYCAAAFLHFRAYFLAPWALFAAWLLLRQRLWRRFGWREAAALVAAALLGLASLYTFWLDWPSLRDVIPFNPILLADSAQDRAMVRNLEIACVICAVALVWARAWLDLAILTWLCGMMFVLQEFAVWHLVIPMAWLPAPARRGYVPAVRLAFLLTVVTLVFGDWFVPAWLGRLWPA